MELYNNKRLRVNHPNDPFRYHVDKTIIVFNMHERTTEEEIYNVFRQIGKLENVEKVNKTRAYVSFKFREDVKSALWLNKVVRGFKWHTSKYYQEANPARKRRVVNDEEEGSSKIKRTDNELYVANIPGDLTEEEVREKFEQFGKIDAVHITQHPSSLVDCCYIVYGSNEEAKKACVMNQQMWMDKRLRVCVVTDEIEVFGEGELKNENINFFLLVDPKKLDFQIFSCWQHCFMSKKFHKNERYSCLVTNIFTKLSQIVCLIITHILVC